MTDTGAKSGAGFSLSWDRVIEGGYARRQSGSDTSQVCFAHYARVHPNRANFQRQARFIANPLKLAGFFPRSGQDAITLTLWKKEERFDAEQLKTQAA
jgi:hypothetical protein